MASTTVCIPSDVDGAVAEKLSVLLVVEDWRTRRFIRTVLKYASDASVIEASCLRTARAIDLLIAHVESDDALTRIEEIGEVAAGNPSMKVLLLSFRDELPCEIPPAWRFLSIPFPTTDFVNCVRELLRSIPSKGQGAEDRLLA